MVRVDWRERFFIVVFGLWLWIRPLIRRASSQRVSYLYSFSGFALAVVALPMFTAGWVGWPGVAVAGIGVFGGLGYALDGFVRRFSMRVAAGQDAKISPTDFLKAPWQPDDGYRLVQPTDDSWRQLYPYVDLSHHSQFIQLENPDLTREDRATLYAHWHGLCPDGFMHLEKLVAGEWRPISVSIMLPLSATGYRAITMQGPKRRSVIDLDQGEILRRVTRKNPFLLIDTWIVDREGGFGGEGHGKTAGRGGNANLLVLRHVAQSWNSSNRFRQMMFLVETANPHLVPVLRALSFRQSGASNIGEAFYQTSKTEFDAVAALDFANVKRLIRMIESVPVGRGTAPPPTGWYYS